MRRRSLLTDKDRTLDTRNPWGGYQTEMEYEAERAKRLAILCGGIIVFSAWTWKAWLNRSLVPHNSENFEYLRKKLEVPGSFPPDFENGGGGEKENGKEK